MCILLDICFRRTRRQRRICVCAQRRGGKQSPSGGVCGDGVESWICYGQLEAGHFALCNVGCLRNLPFVGLRLAIPSITTRPRAGAHDRGNVEVPHGKDESYFD
jgi:hypothetical protein